MPMENHLDYSKDNVPYTPKRFCKNFEQRLYARRLCHDYGKSGFNKPLPFTRVQLKPHQCHQPCAYWRCVEPNRKCGNRIWWPAKLLTLFYASKFAGSSNYWKTVSEWILLLKTENCGTQTRRRTGFAEWVKQMPERQQNTARCLIVSKNGTKRLSLYLHAISFWANRWFRVEWKCPVLLHVFVVCRQKSA